MEKMLLAFLLCAGVARAATPPPYYGVSAPSGGTVTQNISGYIKVAGSNTTAATPTVTISGPTGDVTASSFHGYGGDLTGVISTLFVSSLTVNVRQFGAVADGVTLNDASIAAAIAALPVAGGALYFPSGTSTYLMAAAIDPGERQLTVSGDGWKTLGFGALFGDSFWSTNGAIRGSVIQFKNDTDGFVTASATPRKLYLEHIALLGPGTGTTHSGLNFGPSGQSNNMLSEDVLVANFATGMTLDNSLDNVHSNMSLIGNTTGLMVDNSDDVRFMNLTVDGNKVGIVLASDSLINFFGGLVQANTAIGIHFAPTSTILQGVSFQGMWSEANGKGIVVDNAVAGIEGIAFRDMRESTAYTLRLDASTQAVTRMSFEDCEWGAVDVVFAGSPSFIKVIGGQFASATGLANVAGLVRLLPGAFGGTGNYNSLADQGYTITFSSPTQTVDYANGEIQRIVLSSNTVMALPSNAPVGAKITFIVRQDSTGGWAPDWSNYHGVTWSSSGNTANKYSTITFYKSTGGGSPTWVQVGAQSPWSS